MSTQIISFDITPILIQAGYGAPNHLSSLGTEYTDLYTSYKYYNSNGLTNWVQYLDSSSSGITSTVITGGTYSAGTVVFTNNSGGTFSVTGFSTSTGGNFTGGTVTGSTNFVNGLSACTAVYTNRLTSCDDDGNTIFLSNKIEVNRSIVPLIDATNDLGTSQLRFRNINTVSGISSVWTSTQKIITPELDLGLDYYNTSRKITADNSIIQNDVLNGSFY